MDGCRRWKTVELKVWKGGMPQTGNYFSDSPAKRCRLVFFSRRLQVRQPVPSTHFTVCVDCLWPWAACLQI